VVAVCLFDHVAVARALPLAAGTEFRVNTYTTNTQTFPAIAAGLDGDFAVVWASAAQDGDGFGIFGQRYTSAGVRVGTEFRVNSSPTGHQMSADVAVAANGNFVVVWQSYTYPRTIESQDGSRTGVFGQRYDSGGNPTGSEFQVNSYTTGHQLAPAIAASANGAFVVVWTNYGDQEGRGDIAAQLYDSTGAAVGTEFRVNTYTTNSQVRPAVAAAGESFVVVWTSFVQGGSGSGIFGQRYSTSDSAFGSEFHVNSYTTGLQSSPAVAAATDGAFVVVWHSNEQEGAFGQRYDADGNQVGSEFRVSSYRTRSPKVAVAATGEFVVLSGVPETNETFAQYYDNDGNPVGAEFAVLESATGVAMDADGDFVVVGVRSDGDNLGVFGQRYQLCGNSAVGDA
jgi:hypothetical protein